MEREVRVPVPPQVRQSRVALVTDQQYEASRGEAPERLHGAQGSKRKQERRSLAQGRVGCICSQQGVKDGLSIHWGGRRDGGVAERRGHVIKQV